MQAISDREQERTYLALLWAAWSDVPGHLLLLLLLWLLLELIYSTPTELSDGNPN